MFWRKKNKNKNSYGTVHLKSNLFSKRRQLFVGIFLIVILIVGFSNVGYRKLNQPKTQTAAVKAVSDTLLPSWWTRDYFGVGTCEDKLCQPEADPDSDKLSNSQEYYYNSNPLKSDTNSNGSSDGQDVAAGFDPSRPGKIRLDELEIEDTALLESLVFDQDLIKMVGDMATLNNIPIPNVSDEEITISTNNTKESILAYLSASNDIMSKYFTKDSGLFIESIMSAPESEGAAQVAQSSQAAIGEMKQMVVPSDAIKIHKYQIGLMKLLPTVMMVPNSQMINDPNNTAATDWYDNVRSFSYLWQQISIETIKLQNKYK